MYHSWKKDARAGCETACLGAENGGNGGKRPDSIVRAGEGRWRVERRKNTGKEPERAGKAGRGGASAPFQAEQRVYSRPGGSRWRSVARGTQEKHGKRTGEGGKGWERRRYSAISSRAASLLASGESCCKPVRVGWANLGNPTMPPFDNLTIPTTYLQPVNKRLIFAAAIFISACSIENYTEREEAAFADDSPSAEEAAILARLSAYYTDFSARDWDLFASHFWPEATIATAWAPSGETEILIQTVEEFVVQAPEGPGSAEVFSETMESAEVSVSGDVAQAWVRYSARFGNPGAVNEWRGTDSFSLLRVDGTWRIASLVFAGD